MAFGIDRSGIIGLHDHGLPLGDAVRRLSRLAHQRCRIEVTRPAVIDLPILESVEPVAGVEDRAVQKLEGFLGEYGLVLRIEPMLGFPDDPQRHLCDPISRRADDDSVEILGIVLSLLQPLPATVGTALKIGVGGGLAVIAGDHLLGDDRHDMRGALGEIPTQRGGLKRPERVDHIRADMSGILKRDGKPAAESGLLITGRRELVQDHSARAAATALEITPRIGLGRQPELKLNLRRDDSFHHAELGPITFRGLDGRRRDVRRRFGDIGEILPRQPGAIHDRRNDRALRQGSHMNRWRRWLFRP